MPASEAVPVGLTVLAASISVIYLICSAVAAVLAASAAAGVPHGVTVR